MRREPVFFGVTTVGSLLLHGAVLVMLLLSGGGGGGLDRPPPVYHVQIVEVAPQPIARELQISTEPISTLSPLGQRTLSTDTPEIPSAPMPTSSTPADLPGVSALPDAPTALPPAPSELPSGSASTTPSNGGGLPLPPTPVGDAAVVTEALPALPPPLPLPIQRTPPGGLPPAPATTLPAGGATPTDYGAEQQTAAMEGVRTRVRELNLQFEEAPGVTGTSGTGSAGASLPAGDPALLRLFRNSIREAIRENYAFPAGFDPSLKVRLQLELNRQGDIVALTVVESSGNEAFDFAALLAVRGTRYPAMPSDLPGESYTQILVFSP